MRLDRSVCTIFAVIFSGLPVTFAQREPLPAVQLPSSSAAPASSGIKLDVAVDTKAGQPVPNLRQQDFTVLDNKAQRPITSFRIVSGAQEPVRVILLLDAVNTPFSVVAYMRQSVEAYLKANEGTLAHPSAVAVLSDQGIQMESFSTNGVAMADDLEHHEIGLREINRNSEWSGDERFNICIKAYNQLLDFAGTLPGRKLVIWISPGWPLISGPRVYLTEKQQDQLFSTIVSFSSRMRSEHVTLYNINPVGVTESLERADFYEAFLKGVPRPNDVQPGNLGVQVMAVQSGGLALESNSDVTGMIRRCVTDADSWYEIGFDPPPADKPNEYHHIEVRVAQPGVVVRSRDGYYDNPTLLQPKR